MNVLVDTSVWSLFLRRATPQNEPNVLALRHLIEASRAVIIGPIRQEILSGIREQSHFTVLRQRLRAFPDLALDTADYERAAEFYTVCRRNGVQGSNIDFLICAVAAGRGLAIFTTDLDFQSYRAYIPVALYVTRETPNR